MSSNPREITVRLKRTQSSRKEKASKVALILNRVLQDAVPIMQEALKAYGNMEKPDPDPEFFSLAFKKRVATRIYHQLHPHIQSFTPEELAERVALEVLRLDVIKMRIVHHFPLVIIEKCIQAVLARAENKLNQEVKPSFKLYRKIIIAGLDKVFNKIFSKNGRKYGGLSKGLEEDLIYFWGFSFEKSVEYEETRFYAELHGKVLNEGTFSV